MTNSNTKTFISLYVTRTNSLNNDIFKDLSNGKKSATFQSCLLLTTLSNEDLYKNGFNALFEYKKNSKGKKVLVKKRQFKNDTSAYKAIIENIDKIAEFAKTKEARFSKVNGVRGVISKTNAHFNPTVKSEKSQTVKSEKSQLGTSEKASRTKSEVLKNFADIWASEFGEDLLGLAKFIKSEEGAKIFDYSVDQAFKKKAS